MGHPDFASFYGKMHIFQDFGQTWGAAKTAIPTTTHPIPHLTPSEFLGKKKTWKGDEVTKTQFSRDCPDYPVRFPGNYVYVFPSQEEGQHINKFDTPTNSRDNPKKLFMFIGFLLPDLPSESLSRTPPPLRRRPFPGFY